MDSDELKRLASVASEPEVDVELEEKLLTRLVLGQTVAVTFLVLVTMVGGLLMPSSGLLNLLPLGGVAVAVGLVSFWLLQRQQYRLGGNFFLVGTSVAITVVIFVRGYRDASALYYLWPILGAAMLRGARESVLVATLSALSYLILVAVQRLGYQIPPFPYDPQGEALLTVASRVMMFYLLAFLAWLSAQNLNRALQRARQAVQRWRELNETLEEQVAQRTVDLERRAAELEQLTHNLEDAVAQSRRRALRLEASAQVARAITSVLDPEALLSQIVDLIADRMGFYHVGIFLLDETRQYAVLRAANSAGGQRMLARGHRLQVGKQGVVGYVVGIGRPRVALDVGEDAVHFDSPDLPLTRSEMALPLVARGQVIGALDVQSLESEAFDNEDVAVLGTLADQIAVVLDNARLFEESQSALREMQRTQAQYSTQAWRSHRVGQPVHTVEYARPGVPPLADRSLPEVGRVIATGETFFTVGDGDDQTPASLVVPLKLHGQTIGVLGFQETEPGRVWTEDEIVLTEDVAEQIAQTLESARLFEDTQRRAWREQAAGQITAQIRASASVEDILQTAAEELGRTLGVSRAIVRLDVVRDSESRDETNSMR